jgi:hypothetical protein
LWIITTGVFVVRMLTVLMALLLLLCSMVHAVAQEQLSDEEAVLVKSLGGGQALPPGTFAYQFPANSKQQIQFISQSEQPIAGRVNLQQGSLGSLTLDTEAGTGSGSFQLKTAELTTGDTARDMLMLGSSVLDAQQFPLLQLTDVSCTRLSPTVYRIDAQCHVHGVAQALRMYANIRMLKKVPCFG